MDDYIILYKSKKSSPVYFYTGLIFLIAVMMSVLISTNPESAKNFDSIYSYIIYVILGIIGFVIFLIMLRPDKYILINNKIYQFPKIQNKKINYINMISSLPVLSLSHSQHLSPGKYSLHRKKTFGTYFKFISDSNKPIYITIMSWKPENEKFSGEIRKKTDYFLDDAGFQKLINIYNLQDRFVKIKNF